MPISTPVNSSLYGFGMTVRNVNEALPLGLSLIMEHGRPVTSRGKATLEVPGPVMTVYRHPDERVLLCPERDANPFFHFFESLWILAGADTVDMPARFLSSILDYSDNKKTFHGAYGHRLRMAHGFDQLEEAVKLLRYKPDTRQCVLSIWHPGHDLAAETKDVPCNDTIAFKVRDGALNMTVFNRSNDVIWGAYGANAVQFSIIQEYVAARVGVDVGKYVQVSDSYHVYVDHPLWARYATGDYRPSGHVSNPYERIGGVSNTALFRSAEDAEWAMRDAEMMNHMMEFGLGLETVYCPPTGAAWRSHLFTALAAPMAKAYDLYRLGELRAAMHATEDILHTDWKVACSQWLERRLLARAAKEAA